MGRVAAGIHPTGLLDLRRLAPHGQSWYQNQHDTTSRGMFYLWPAPDGTVSFKQTRPSANIDNPENATRSNWNNWKIIVPKRDRAQFAAFADRPINEGVTAFGDLLFYHAHSVSGREPVNFKNTDDPGIYLPAANPWNPFGVRPRRPRRL